ncbi:uncharacterized protein LOC120352837 [Nilaparvata lugens]|uniref:uncharacterized protein LOC120352837 n=1 Tax=Nilaparvata lugens TaxID=108931 RepID=UPI00193D5504|nr:uncharacterized protein LOC120352837 [Nilaparvata lugens]
MSLSPRKKSDHNLSANQFQEKLHTWLRDQGLLSELKSHLRMQMVTALQDGSPSINRQFSISPKIQALTVLIADFFLQQGYNFSLSVLTTEVPFIGQMFSHLSQSSVREGLENGRLLAERFSARDVEDILETLGMPPGSTMHAEILSLYNDTENKDSLLVCIIRSLTFLNSEKSNICT